MSRKLSPINQAQNQSGGFLNTRQKNKLVMQDADEDVRKNLTSPTQEALLIAIKESYEEMYNERLIELQKNQSQKLNQLMNLVEDLKQSNLELREEIKVLKINQNTNRGSSSSVLSDAHLRRLEIELEERFKAEMEDYREKLERETQEILMTKGITRERMREVEEEVKEEFRMKYEQQVGNSPRNINSGFNSERLNDSQHKSNTRSVLDGNIGSLDGKLQIRNEIRKKERLLDVRMKQKMALQKNKLGSELEKQYEEMKKDLLARNEYERLELSRQKANFNIGRKKLKDEQRALKLTIQREREHFTGVISQLKKKLEGTIERNEVLERGIQQNFNLRSEHIEEQGGIEYDGSEEEDYGMEEQEVQFESSARDFNKDAGNNKQKFSAQNHGDRADENQQDGYNGGEQVLSMKKLYPLNHKFEEMRANFGDTDSEIFEDIIDGEPRLLSHEWIQKSKSVNNLLNNKDTFKKNNQFNWDRVDRDPSPLNRLVDVDSSQEVNINLIIIGLLLTLLGIWSRRRAEQSV